MIFNQDAPLSRIASESLKAHAALMDYFLMGGGRSLDKLRQRYGRDTAVNEPPTIHLRTLEKWSSPDRFNWQARIAQQKANDNEIALAEFRARHMSKEEIIARLSDQARGDMGEFAQVRSQDDLDGHPFSELVKTITQNYTQTQRGSGEDAQTEIKARIVLGLYDAQEALKWLGKYYGLFTDKVDISGGLAVKGYELVSPDDWDEEGEA